MTDSTRDTGQAAEPGTVSRLLAEIARAAEADLAGSWREPLKTGDVVGRYQIRREIGRGGFGAVYEALDPQLGRVVALKALKPGRSKHPVSEEWIQKEAEAVAKLDHPAIVTIHDVGTCPAGAYLVMELLRGETLAKRIENGPLPVDEALRIAEQMAEGLAHAHSRGVLHRDLKPANVFVCEDGRVKLLDFGLAHLLGTGGSDSAGTPAYMAPEQAEGLEIDERADVYAAGMVLGEALTGHRPSRAGSAGEWPHAHRPGLPRGVERQVEAAISADPAARPRDGASWLAVVQRLQRERARPRILRRVALLAGVGILLGVLASGIATWRVWRRQVPVGKITVAVADFANQTGDPELDGLSGLLSASLEQSKRLRVLTRSRMWDYARELGKGNVDRLDEPLAREIGRRADARALLLASVRRLGPAFLVELRALDPERDEYLFTVRERAPDKAAVLGLVDRLSERTRIELKESQQEVSSSQVRVEVAVTGSLEAHAHYFRAQQIMAESLDSDLARKEYAQALAIDPEFVQAHLQMALLAALGEADGSDGDADVHLAAVLRQAGRIPEKDRHLAEVLAELRMPPGSSDDGRERTRVALRSAVAALPDSKELLALAGQRAVDDDDYEVAIQRLEQALRIDPGYGPALIWLSTAYDKLGRKLDAVAAARRAVAARPGPVAYAVLAQSLAIAGDRPGAASAIRQVYSSGKEIPYFVSEMIWPVHAYAGDWKQAESELRRWAVPEALPTRRLMSLSALSFVLNAQGREREVREIAIQLEEGGQPELALWARAMSAMLSGDLPSASRDFGSGGGVDAAHVVAYLGDRGGAERLAKELKARTVAAELYRGIEAWKGGNADVAVPIFRGVIAMTDDGAAVRYLGEILCEGAEPAEGAILLGRWLERFPSAVALGSYIFRPRVLLLAARCLERQGRIPEARSMVDRLLLDWGGADSGLPILVEAKSTRARLGAAKG